MPNFSQRFAMRCTEQQWEKAQYEGKPLLVKLVALGYDLSELQFYPNKPYVVTYYKQSSNKISTTNTPFKDGREVMEVFDPALFYALCCQLEGDHISAGEFITTNQGKVYQVHVLLGNWLRHDYPDGKNTAFAKASVHKSTYQELFAWFSGNNLPKIEPNIVFSSMDLPTSEVAISQEVDFHPLDFKSLLSWYADHNSIVWGIVEGGEIHSKIKVISHISKENVQLVGDLEPTSFSQLFRSQHHFLNYALSKI